MNIVVYFNTIAVLRFINDVFYFLYHVKYLFQSPYSYRITNTNSATSKKTAKEKENKIKESILLFFLSTQH